MSKYESLRKITRCIADREISDMKSFCIIGSILFTLFVCMLYALIASSCTYMEVHHILDRVEIESDVKEISSISNNPQKDEWKKEFPSKFELVIIVVLSYLLIFILFLGLFLLIYCYLTEK